VSQGRVFYIFSVIALSKLSAVTEMVIHIHRSVYRDLFCSRIFTFALSMKARDHWGDQDVGGWTILKWILER
jgi:hypothetical protein